MSAGHEHAIRLLVAAYTPARWDDDSLAVYLYALDDLPADVVQLAVLDLIRQPLRFMPRPGEVRQAVLDLVRDERLDAGDAWRNVIREISRVGRAGTPVLDDLTARTVDAIGGWGQTCNSTNTTADRARFLDAYDRLAQRADRETLLAPALGGSIERALGQLSARLALPSGHDSA